MHQATSSAPPPAATPALAPVSSGERIQTIDVLRGFALLGILVVNMELFDHSMYHAVVGFTPATWYDQAARWFIDFFATGKFYSLFALLFGLGMAIQMGRAQARGIRFVPLYARRMAVLLAFGLIHAYLFWVGDILILYALLGFVLLFAFRNCRPRTLIAWAVALILLMVLFNAASWALLEWGKSTPAGAQTIEGILAAQTDAFRTAAADADAVYATGSFAAVTRQRAQDMRFIATILPFMALNVLAMMLVGLAVGKLGICADIAGHRLLLRRVLWWGLAVGIVGNLLYVVAGEFSERDVPGFANWLSTTGQSVGAPALALFYAASIALLMQQAAWQRRLGRLAPAGQMAITNYLAQSVICTLIFYGYGLGLAGRVGAAAGIVLTLLIYAVQVAWSEWWLKRFRFGPVEWLWRTLTYMRRQPMRRRPPAPPAPLAQPTA
jgi:uncharacterized protein